MAKGSWGGGGQRPYSVGSPVLGALGHGERKRPAPVLTKANMEAER